MLDLKFFRTKFNLHAVKKSMVVQKTNLKGLSFMVYNRGVAWGGHWRTRATLKK